MTGLHKLTIFLSPPSLLDSVCCGRQCHRAETSGDWTRKREDGSGCSGDGPPASCTALDHQVWREAH